MLMLAYRSGIFPMADSRDDPEVFWVEPQTPRDPAAGRLPLLALAGPHPAARALFGDLQHGICPGDGAMRGARAAIADGSGESWISRRIFASYLELHRLGHAHSIECWHDGQLVGGLYGVGFDRVFCGESMFSQPSDASKVALAWLVAALRRCGAELLDCQFITPHLASLGTVEISQERYVSLLKAAQRPYSWVLCLAGRSGVGDGAADGEAAGDALATGAALALPAGFAALLARGRRVFLLAGELHRAVLDPDVIDRVLDDIERRRILEQPAGKHRAPGQDWHRHWRVLRR